MRLVPTAVLVIGLYGSARAQSADVTREFQAGVDAFRLGKLDEARAHFDKAKALDPKLAGPHRFLAAVAQAERRWPDCIAEARLALALNPSSDELADTRKLHEDCRTGAGRVPYRGEFADNAAIAVTTNVPGVTVKIGGLIYGGTPLAPRPIPAGKLGIDLVKSGWKPAHVEVEALPGVVTDVAVELDPDQETQPADHVVAPTDPSSKSGWLAVGSEAGSEAEIAIDGATRRASPDGRYELAPGTHVIELRRPSHDPWRRRVRISAGQKTQVTPAFVPAAPRAAKEHTGMLLVGGGAAIGAFGFAGFLLSSRASAEARDIVRVETARLPGPIDESVQPLRTRDDFDDARSRARRWALISNISYGVAAATLGAGAYLLFRGAAPRDTPPPWAIAPVAGGAMLTAERSW